MTVPKTHFAIGAPAVAACGRGRRLTDNVYSVDCLTCRGREDYHNAWKAAEAKREAAFMAQTPQPFAEPWRQGNIVCSECSETLFRHGDRTCYGHYDNFHCANCGHVESRLTETGMCF